MFFRVVPQNEVKEINGHIFQGFGSHHNSYPHTYLTAAAAVGITRQDIDTFVKRLDKVLAKCKVDDGKLKESAELV